MLGAEAGVATRQNLTAVTDKLTQSVSFFVVDVVNLIDAEEVDLATPEEAASTATSSWATSAVRTSTAARRA